MITVCPKCALTLAVTASDLRLGQGLVRCGRCNSVFSALAALQDDLAETIEQPRPPGLLEFDPAATDTPPQPEAPSLLDASDTLVVSEEPLHPATEAANDPGAAEIHSANDDDIEPSAANDPQLEEMFDVQVESILVQAGDPIEPAAANDEAPPAVAPRSNWRLLAACMALALLLGLQWMHQNRNTLALREDLRPALSSFYRGLGSPLAPAWDMAGFVVRRQGEMLAADSGSMTLRASIVNQASHSQPLPLLRIILLDRFGTRLAARDLTPGEYLAGGKSSPLLRVGLLAKGQRVDAEIALADPGPNAVGFELDACLPLADRRLRCAGSQLLAAR